MPHPKVFPERVLQEQYYLRLIEEKGIPYLVIVDDRGNIMNYVLRFDKGYLIRCSAIAQDIAQKAGIRITSEGQIFMTTEG